MLDQGIPADKNPVSTVPPIAAATPKIDLGEMCGIACPGCGVVENYDPKTLDRRPDNSKYRTCNCRSCGAKFSTIEVPIAVLEVKRRVRRPNQPKPNNVATTEQ